MAVVAAAAESPCKHFGTERSSTLRITAFPAAVSAFVFLVKITSFMLPQLPLQRGSREFLRRRVFRSLLLVLEDF